MQTATVSQNPKNVTPETEFVSWRLSAGIRMNAASDMLRGTPRVFRAICAPIAFLLEAISIGVMRSGDVRQMVNQTYASRPGFYDPRRYQLSFEAELLPHLSPLRQSGRLLDVFCGQGREAELFANAGYEVTAIDQFDWMIAAAKRYQVEAGFQATFCADSFSSFSSPQPFDIVYTSCWMYSTCQGGHRRQEFLHHLGRLCKRDGLAVISYVSQRSGSKLAATVRFFIARATALLTAGSRHSELGERIYSGLFWHHLDDGVVSVEVKSAGWDIVQTIPGNGMAPTFVILRLDDQESML